MLVVACNASTTLRSVLARIPTDLHSWIAGVLVSDYHSSDDIYQVALEVQRREAGLRLTIVRQPRNLGYGGNQKGRFDYDRRGILDRGHVRLFTRRSFERILHRSGWHVLRSDVTGLPFDVVDRGGADGLARHLRRTIGRIDALGVRARPTLFGYQLLYELEPAIGRV